MKNLLMFFKKANPEPLFSSEDTSAPTEAGKPASARGQPPRVDNPYIEARREWNERYGDYISQARNWRYIAFLCALIAFAAVIGVGYIGAQNKIVPYVVQVDKFGAAIAVGPGDKATALDSRVVKSFLGRFVQDWRSVTVDRVAQKDAVTRLYSMLSINTPAHKKANEYFEENNPFVRLQTGTVSVELSGILPISDKSWQVEWAETYRDLRGEVTNKLRFKASFFVGITPPTDERQIIVNPLGIYITDLNFAQQL
jgi:type IV secretion system protein TrbF